MKLSLFFFLPAKTANFKATEGFGESYYGQVVAVKDILPHRLGLVLLVVLALALRGVLARHLPQSDHLQELEVVQLSLMLHRHQVSIRS